MFSSLERAITTLSGTISILTFFAALANWFGAVPNYSPSSERIAAALILLYAITCSYFIGKFLRNTLEQNKPTAHLSVAICVVYCFSLAFITDVFSQEIATEKKQIIANIYFHIGYMFYIFSLAFMYIIKIIYPNGFSIKEYFFAPFRLKTWSGLGLLALHMLLPPVFLITFGVIPR